MSTVPAVDPVDATDVDDDEDAEEVPVTVELAAECELEELPPCVSALEDEEEVPP